MVVVVVLVVLEGPIKIPALFLASSTATPKVFQLLLVLVEYNWWSQGGPYTGYANGGTVL